EYVQPVMVRKRQGRFHFFVVDHPRKTLFEEQPLILLDGVPVFNTDKIMAFDPRKVQRLDVMSRRYYLGSSVFSGVLSYTTYAGDMQGFDVDPKALMQEYEGLQEQREFYSPAYASPEQLNSRRPDLRTMLYWNPKAFTAADGKQNLQFYTSDQPGNYMLVVYGLTDDGLAGTAVHTFEVKQEGLL
ncbi:MAG: hypothetical protein LPK03_03250, partial [Pontibacter sp.]|nr:hypothetical protein [Pontibacter sp.]